MTVTDLDDFTLAYVRCALWASTDDDGDPLDVYSPDDVAPASLAAMAEDCADFRLYSKVDLDGVDPARAGQDFWLTRNGHGSGFWDGDYPDQVGQRLTRAAKTYGSSYLYLGDDGLIHVG